MGVVFILLFKCIFKFGHYSPPILLIEIKNIFSGIDVLLQNRFGIIIK